MTPDEPINFDFEDSDTPETAPSKQTPSAPSYAAADVEDPWGDAAAGERSDSSSSAEDALAEAFGSEETPLSGDESSFLELPNFEQPTSQTGDSLLSSLADNPLSPVDSEPPDAGVAEAEEVLFSAFAETERPTEAIDLVELPPPAEMQSSLSADPGIGAANRVGLSTTPSFTASYESTSELQRQQQALQQEIAELQKHRDKLRQELADAQMAMGRLVQDGLKELESRKQALQISVEQLERRQERIRNEMRTTFAGVSQDLAIRVQSFKDYLVGSLQDLALTAEQLELPKPLKESEKRAATAAAAAEPVPSQTTSPRFAEQAFQEQSRKIRGLIDQYRNRPDYYGPTWQLRRTFEPIHAERVSNWFFTQGGRGAIRTMGSRLQNILVSSATISVLYSLYGDRLRTLILADSPERLGEWRRGLQDCLGITRGDFGPDRGVALFEDPELMAQKADRSQKDGLMPFIVLDETEEQVNLSLLQFPLWLAFAPNPQQVSSSNYRDREW